MARARREDFNAQAFSCKLTCRRRTWTPYSRRSVPMAASRGGASQVVVCYSIAVGVAEIMTK